MSNLKIEIARGKYTQMSLIEYAERNGITGEELEFLRRYGTTDFNRTWFYVSEEMVRDDLGQPPSKDMMNDFRRRHLTRPLREGEHYAEIEPDDPVVDAYFHSAILPNGNTTPKRGNRAKYYKISGEGLKLVSMMMNNPVGDRARQYFLKIEQLAGDMLREHDREQTRELEELRVKAQALSIRTDRLEQQGKLLHQDFVVRLLAKRGKIYIATNYRYGMDRLFKVGSTTTAPNKRLVGLNTGHPAGDNLTYVYIVDCDDVVEAERRLARYAKQTCDGKEFYKGDFQFLKAAVDIAVDGVNDDYDQFSGEVHDCMVRYADDPLSGIAPEVLQKMRPAEPLQIEAPRVYEPGPNPEYSKAEYRILIDSAKDYFRATKPGYDWDRDAHNRFARIIWQDFKVYLKGRGVAAKDVNRMRMRFFDMCEHVSTLRVVLR